MTATRLAVKDARSQRSSHAARNRTADRARRPDAAEAFRPGIPMVTALQRAAGNRGVTSLLRPERVTVQRGLFDALGGLLGGDLRQQASGLAGQGVQAGVGALAGRIGGPFGSILQGAGGGLGTAAGSLISGDTAGSLATLRQTGADVAGPAAQAGMGMLGNAIGGPVGGFLGGLGGSVGQGLSSIISGGDPAAAGKSILGEAGPGLMGLASRFLGGI